MNFPIRWEVTKQSNWASNLRELASPVNLNLELWSDRLHFFQSRTVNGSQRLFNRVTEVMHYISHAYHAVSDIMVDFSRPPPRELRAQPFVISQPALVQHSIPIQVS